MNTALHSRERNNKDRLDVVVLNLGFGFGLERGFFFRLPYDSTGGIGETLHSFVRLCFEPSGRVHV